MIKEFKCKFCGYIAKIKWKIGCPNCFKENCYKS